jgi:glycosyltransferase involved in cell wall biosynthesis
MLRWLDAWRSPPAPPAAGALRVVVELNRFDKGGLERVVLDTARSFDRARFALLIISVGRPGALAAEARRAGLRVEGLPRREPARAYARLLDAFQPALAVTHLSTFGYALLAARNIPIVSVIHNVYGYFTEPMRDAFLRDDRQVAHYISVSRKATQYVTERFGLAPARITTIPNGLDVAALPAQVRPASRARLGIAPGDYVFLNVAAYNLHKGHHLMAAAMRLLLRERQDIRIVCVGNVVVAPHVAALRARLLREGLDRHMLLPGYSRDVPGLLAMADAFLLPSFIEGWSIAMNEAMAFGKPLLLTDTGGAAEVIEDEDIGILLPNEYGPVTDLDSALLDRLAYATSEFRVAADLAAAMARFADNRAHWAAAGAHGAAKLRQRYDLRETVRRHESVMLAVAAGRAPGECRPADQA